MIIATFLLLFQQQQNTMRVTPDAQVSASGGVGGPFSPAGVSYTIRNAGVQTIQWSASADQNWITLSATSGTIAANKGTAITATIDADANALATGNYLATITFTNGSTQAPPYVYRQINLSVTAASTLLVPGTEWGGATSEPGQIGTGTAKCIARWDVVPYQTLVEATTPVFTVGVIAFHIAGIDKVSFAVEGGSFVDVTEMTLNPITGVWEYCVGLELSDFTDEVIELRAIAYPKSAAPQAAGTNSYPGGGFPKLLDANDSVADSQGLLLYVDADTPQTQVAKYVEPRSGNDTTGDGSQTSPYRTWWKAAQAVAAAQGGDAGNGIVYLANGTYDFAGRPGGGSVPATATQYITLKPWPAMALGESVIFTTGPLPDPSITKVHLYDVTLNRVLYGDPAVADCIWLDHSRVWGPGREISEIHSPFWDEHYWTDIDSQDTGSALASDGWGRNIRGRRTKAAAAWPRFLVNSTFDTVDAGDSGLHADYFVWHVGPLAVDNSIIYGTRGTNIAATIWAMAGQNKTRTNFAAVNCSMQGGNIGFVGETTHNDIFSHVLLWNISYSSVWVWLLEPADWNNVSIRGCYFETMDVAGGGGIIAGSFDNNHVSGGISPGTGLTTGDPMLGANLVPLPGSPLRGRMNPNVILIDVNGAMRPTPGTVGSFEE